MSKVIIAIAIVASLIVVYPYISTISEIAKIKGAYIPKWSEIPPIKKGVIYEKAIQICKSVNDTAKLLLEIAGIFVTALTIVEYYKYHKIYKEG